MTLTKYYAVTCDNCWRQPQRGTVYVTAREARRLARLEGFVRLPHPESVRKGYTTVADARGKHDYCKTCGADVQKQLDEIERERAEAAARPVDAPVTDRMRQGL